MPQSNGLSTGSGYSGYIIVLVGVFVWCSLANRAVSGCTCTWMYMYVCMKSEGEKERCSFEPRVS